MMIPSPQDLLGQHAIARCLERSFDGSALEADLEGFDATWWRKHAGPYHNGGWESVSLWAPRGDPLEQTSKGGAFAATPALLKAPSLRAVLDAFPCERNRVRLMRLNAGGKILTHSDPLHSIDPDLVRLHVPVVTNPEVHFLVNGRRVVMDPGETWYVDVRFPHSVENRGDSPRVHLVMDLVRNPDLDDLLHSASVPGTGRLTGYLIRHSLPGPLRRLLGVGN